MRNKKESKQSSEFIQLEGIVQSVDPGLDCDVLINFQGIEHVAKCYVAGKLKNRYIRIEKGDKVKVELSIKDIDRGRIIYRLTKRVSQPPRRPKK